MPFAKARRCFETEIARFVPNLTSGCTQNLRNFGTGKSGYAIIRLSIPFELRFVNRGRGLACLTIPNRLRRLVFICLDTASLLLALFASIWLRFEELEVRHLSYFFTVWTVIIPLSLLIFGFMGLYRRSVRFTSIPDLVAIFSGVTLSTIVKMSALYFHQGLVYSRSIIIIDWFLSLLFIGFSRVLPRLILSLAEYEPIRTVVYGRARNPAKRILIFGAGHAGENVAREA